MRDREKFKILIVDDMRTNLIALTQILEPQYDVVTATDGKSAITTAEEHVPDLILLDIIMPGMSGFEVLPLLKRSEITKDVPVIFLTGLDSVEDEERGLNLGAVDYIAKPFHKSIIKARVRTHLKMAAYVRTIERLCMLDTLTELPNRRGFDSRLKIEWSRSIRERIPISILMIDIDGFKDYNDTYGHPKGDVLLQTIAYIFGRTLKRPTDFVARWGGEEFAVLLSNTDLPGALMVAEQIRENIERTVIPCDDGTTTSITVSIGVNTVLPDANTPVPEFLSKADKALYSAKNSGKNRVCPS